MSKKVTSILLVIMIIIGSMATTFAATSTNNSRQLMVSGNQLVYVDDPSTSVRLTGVNIAGGEWTGTPAVERLERSAIEAINNWNCNFLRIPVSRSGWYGDYSYVADGGNKYRAYIDSLIDIAGEAGVYVILDFHHYKAFDNEQYLTFWQEAAVRYKNNPTVLFGILNEPHSVGWEVWRNGDGSSITGHQQVVEMIRDLGAKNIIVAGGLDWGYSLTGITNGYALVDQGTNNNSSKAGYGIMYDTHVYPWKGRTSNWDSSSGAVRKLYPIVVGECGWDAETNKAVGGKTYAEGDVMYHDKWVPELLAWMDDTDTYGAPANYTAYCLHPSSSPRLIGDKDNWKDDANYSYPPTDFWGVYIKAHLAKCESERKEGLVEATSIRVVNPITDYYKNNELDLSEGALAVTYSDGSSVEIALTSEGVSVTGFDSSTTGTRTLTVSYKGLTTTYNVNINEFTSWDATATFDSGSYITFASNAFNVRWTGQTSADTMVKTSATGEGLDGSNGLGFNYARSGGWGGVQTATVPDTWDWSKTQYISFYAKIIPTSDNTSNNFAMSIGGTSGKCSFTATTQWQYFSFDLSEKDLTAATQLQWTINNAGTGKLVIDNLTISNYAIAEGELPESEPEPEPEPEPVTLTSISVSNAKTAYEVGDEFVAPAVTAVYSDGTTKTVTATFTGYDMSTAGTYTVTAAYEGKTATYKITVEKVEVIVPEEPQNGPKEYLNLDFEDAAYQVADGVENTKVIETSNKATGEKFSVNLYPNNSSRYYRIYTDSTTYIAPNGRKQNCAFDFALPQPVSDTSNKVYVDMRIKRVSYALDDPISVAFTDDSGNVIFYINYTQANIPTLVASQSYGVATPEASLTDVTYPCEAGWRCVRAIIDFDTATFQLYQGADFYNMTGFVEGVDTFSFKSAATNLGRITNYGVANRKGSLGFDDIRVYTVADEEEGTKVYVKQNFDDAVLDVADYITDASTGAFSIPKGTHIAVNAVNSATGKNLPWYTYNDSRDVTSSGYLYAPYAIAANADGSTNYALMPDSRKRQARAYVTMDTYDENGNKTAAPVYDEGKKTVVSMRIRRFRADLDDPVTLSLSDIYGEKIFSIVYKQNMYPQLVASTTYGGEANTEASVANYPFNSEWMYLKAEIDFEAKTFKLYTGETEDNMTSYITGTDSFDFASSSAANFYKLTMEHKGSLGIDDFTVYTE